MPKQQFFAVRKGRVPGVYNTEEEMMEQIEGFLGAEWKILPHSAAARGWARLGTPIHSRGTVKPLRVALREVKPNISSPALSTAARGGPPKRASPRDTASVEELDIKPILSQPSNDIIDLTLDDADPEDSDEVETKPTFCKLHTLSNADANVPSTLEFLSDQQKKILELVKSGQNVFFTGSAGVGKSLLLRHIIKMFQGRQAESIVSGEARAWLEETENGLTEEEIARPRPYSLAITASTGLAAINIGGRTLHSWSGIGLGKQEAKVLAGIIRRDSRSRHNWQSTQTLIIDEISMIKAQLLDKLDYIGRYVRRNDAPFGGIQVGHASASPANEKVIICGDFFQLAPVPDKDTRTGEREVVKFAFEADCWDSLIPPSNRLELTRIFRQTDADFINLLETIRKGQPSHQQITTLRRCSRRVAYADGVEPVGLYPTKFQVDAINLGRLNALPGEVTLYEAVDIPGVDSQGARVGREEATQLLNTYTLWKKSLSLKVGAQVMCVTNVKHTRIVNGSTGTIVGFEKIGQGLAASDECRSPAEGTVFGGSDRKWPVVDFAPSRHDPDQTIFRILMPEMHVDILNADNNPEATRRQVPLILAWAMTIHKGQGQTLERLKVDLHRGFADGQAYVAISRATSLDGLELYNFSADKVKTNKKVLKWSEACEKAQAKANGTAWRMVKKEER